MRLGTPAGTTRGFGIAEFQEVGELIARGARCPLAEERGGGPRAEAAVREKVKKLVSRFPIYKVGRQTAEVDDERRLGSDLVVRLLSLRAEPTMRCPNCASLDTQVKDSRPTEDTSVIRRRRVCLACNFRFTTFERVQLRELIVIKRNGRRVPFDRDKLLRSVQIALRKRPVEPERIDQAVSKIVRELESQGESEVSSETIGEMVMESAARARRRRLRALRLGLSQFPRGQGLRSRARRAVGRGGRQAGRGG